MRGACLYGHHREAAQEGRGGAQNGALRPLILSSLRTTWCPHCETSFGAAVAAQPGKGVQGRGVVIGAEQRSPSYRIASRINLSLDSLEVVIGSTWDA